MRAKTLTCLSCAQLNRVPDDKLSANPKCATCGTALMPSKPMDVDPAILAKAAQNDDLPLVVDFWAPWCGPCKQMAPVFAQAAQQLEPQVRLIKINSEEEQTLSARFGIRSIPTLILFKAGKEVERVAGAMDLQNLLAWTRQHL